jgi:large subunit ribosomal protein L24
MKKQKLHIKKGDNVLVLSGDSRGMKGKVLIVDPAKKTAIVEGVRMVSKHTKPNKDNPQGGIIQKASPIHVSNLMVVDADGSATRIGRKIDEKKNKLVRYSKKSGEVIK